jgi:hypothetical protein
MEMDMARNLPFRLILAQDGLPASGEARLSFFAGMKERLAA